MKVLGVVVSVNLSYVYLCGEINVDYIGINCVVQVVWFGILMVNGVLMIIYFDLFVVLVELLLLMWMVVNCFG